jgi:hypothetical protein
MLTARADSGRIQMPILEKVVLEIGVIISLGIFLDSHHLETAQKEAVRLFLVRMYEWLYDFPISLRQRWGAALDKMNQPVDYDVRTGKLAKPGRSWVWWLYYLVFIPGFAICFAYFLQWDFKEDGWAAKTYDITREGAWWIGLLSGVLFAVVGALILMAIGAWYFLAIAIPVLLILMILESIRRFLLLTLKKAQGRALLSVAAALAGLIDKFLHDASLPLPPL